MTILYDYKESLYINMTNKCPCACVFCIRDETDHVGNSDSLWLDHEPTVEEVKNEFEKGTKGICRRIWPKLAYIATVTGVNSIYDDKMYFTWN